MPASNAREVRITLRSRRDFLKTTQQFNRKPGEFPTTAPAGWCAALPGKPGQPVAPSADYTRWLEVNLGPYGGAFTQVPAGGGKPEMFCSNPQSAGAAPTTQPFIGPEYKKKVDKTRDIYGRLLERGERYNWQHAKELIATAVEDYWAHGTVRRNMPGRC